MVIGIYIPIITLNMNGLNAPTKRNREDWVEQVWGEDLRVKFSAREEIGRAHV